MSSDIKIRLTSDKIDTFEMMRGDTLAATADFSATASEIGVSASSVVWSVEDGNAVSISGTPTISSNVSVGTLVADANKEGCTLIKVKATMSDSQTRSKMFKVITRKVTC